MNAKCYEQLIAEGLRGLSCEALAEITDFVFFVRKRLFEPEAFQEHLRESLLRAELKQLSRDEEAHLEGEFEGYEQSHPRK